MQTSNQQFYADLIEAYRKDDGEFLHLKSHVYLDHAANGVYMSSVISDYKSKLTCTSSANDDNLALSLFANPHSQSESGLYTNKLVNIARNNVLSLFKTNSNEYDVVFVANATHGLKVIAESFEFCVDEEDTAGDQDRPVFAYLNDNHTSVVGMRQIAWQKPACDVYCLFEVDKNENCNLFHAKLLESKASDSQRLVKSTRSLFVYPAQSNFSGRKYTLDLVDEVHRNGVKVSDSGLNGKFSKSDWFVCLDAASFVSTSVLDLSKVKPDFAVVSFYKIFGFPTGLGCILIRKCERTKAALRNKTYFGGGTISMALIDENKFEFRTSNRGISFHEHFEDGTLPYLEIIGLNVAIEKFRQITNGKFMEPIEDHVKVLTSNCMNKLMSLKHYNDVPLVEIYRNYKNNLTCDNYGPIIAFNLKNSRNKYIGFSLVNKLAQEHKIHLRVGCFCNIGCCQMYLTHLKENKNFVDNFQIYGHKCGDHIDLINGLPTGAIRISFGYCSIEDDVCKLIEFLRMYFIDKCNSDLPDQRADSSSLVKEKQYFKITKIYLYPIKSCAPIEVESSWPLCDAGLLYDRNWILMDTNQIPLTQKRLPDLAKLHAHIDINRNLFRLIFDQNESFDLELESRKNSCKTDLVNVCTHNIFGYDCGDDVAKWLKNVFKLENECRLIRISNDGSCTSSDVTGENNRMKQSFNNQAEFLLVSENSVKNIRSFLLSKQEVNNEVSKQELYRIDHQLALQFRPNFVVQILEDDYSETENLQYFNEENWKSIKILNKNIKLKMLSLCTRCQMININQANTDLHTKLFTHLLKQLYTLKSNSKFGVYLSQIKDKEDNLAIIDDEHNNKKQNNLLTSNNNELIEIESRQKIVNNEICIGDIGIASTID